jgi:acyl carrier protein
MKPTDARLRDVLRDIWTEVLNREPADADDFFSLGGDSLAMVRILFMVEERLGLEMSVEDMFIESFVFGASADVVEKALVGAQR